MKPLKKYKALQLFNLRCPHCHSGEVYHNADLTEAIAMQKSRDELVRIRKERGLEIEWEIKDNTKYFPMLISERMSIKEREYLVLSDDI
ncbi:MAG TPA: hypothetical protein VN958_13365 [Chitinophagaceae bacterium]|nr:hypothetical protein [Chitinophagaceae bacterium]